MTATEPLNRLAVLGVRLTIHDDRLSVDAPAGTMSAGLRAELAAHKTELLHRLGGSVPAQLCAQCEAPIALTRSASDYCSEDCALAAPVEPWEPTPRELPPVIPTAAELLEVGQQLGWPELRIARPLTLGAGEEGWRKFIDFGQRWFGDALEAATA